jgi:hypothetical protein
VHPLSLEKLVVRIGDHIDDGIANGEHVEASVGHEISGKKRGEMARLAAHWVTSNLASEKPRGHSLSMRRFALASILLLAACATRPEQPPAPEQPGPVVPAQRQVTRLTGMTTHDVTAHFGRPALQVQEGASLKLQFRGNYCVLDVYLYPGPNGVLRVTHVDTRLPSGADADQATCISALEYPS